MLPDPFRIEARCGYLCGQIAAAAIYPSGAQIGLPFYLFFETVNIGIEGADGPPTRDFGR